MTEADANKREVRRQNTYVTRNTRMKSNDKNVPAIVWAADDPSLHSFETTVKKNDGELETKVMTVADYFLERRGIRLEFPKMPIVSTPKGFFPVEFMFQCLEKMKGANSPDHVKSSLAFNDEFSGLDRIQHLVRQRTIMARETATLMASFGLRFDEEPVSLRAKILPEPTLRFQNSEARTRDGSWDLRNVRFDR